MRDSFKDLSGLEAVEFGAQQPGDPGPAGTAIRPSGAPAQKEEQELQGNMLEIEPYHLSHMEEDSESGEEAAAQADDEGWVPILPGSPLPSSTPTFLANNSKGDTQWHESRQLLTNESGRRSTVGFISRLAASMGNRSTKSLTGGGALSKHRSIIDRWTKSTKTESSVARLSRAIRKKVFRGNANSPPTSRMSNFDDMRNTMLLDGRQVYRVGSMVMISKLTASSQFPSNPQHVGCMKRELTGERGVNSMYVLPDGYTILTGGSMKSCRNKLAPDSGWIQVWEMEDVTSTWSLRRTIGGDLCHMDLHLYMQKPGVL